MKDFWKFFVPVAGVVFLVWLVWWCIAYHVQPNAGIGDLFGGVSALFSGLAFAGVVTAVILQGEELQLQRQELKLTREEVKKTADANQAAAQALGKQIDMQLKAAELSAISSLLNSVNSQLGPGTSSGGPDLTTLINARGLYHKRLHETLQAMGRGV